MEEIFVMVFQIFYLDTADILGTILDESNQIYKFIWFFRCAIG